MAQKEIEALKEEHAIKTSKAEMAQKISTRKEEMEERNRKAERKDERTRGAKNYIYQTR